jgi:hypothetical protein
MRLEKALDSMTKKKSKRVTETLQLFCKKQLDDATYEQVLAVSLALLGVRHDLQLQDIAQLVLDLHTEDKDWATIGFAVLSCTIESSLQ